jgi:YegS/Rv2252/BmrU family lipid kinase
VAIAVAIIINPRSGGAGPAVARQRAERATAVLMATGIEGEVFVTERRQHARDLAAAAVTRGVGLVIAWGGDGTINEVASSLMRTPAALGIVPAGSGNGLARELGLASRPEIAIQRAIGATPRAIDAGELCQRPFFSIAGIGIDAHVATIFDRHGTGRRGLANYARHTAAALWNYRCQDYRIDSTPASRVLLITIANSAQFGNGMRIAPGARIDDGELDLVVFEERSRLSTVGAMPRLVLGGMERVPGLSTRRIRDVVIECDTPMIGHVDGEPFEVGTRAEARVLPGVLRVAVG